MAVGWVYLVQPLGGGPVKVGFSSYPYERVAYINRRLKDGTWLQVIGLLPGGRDLERELHRRWAEHRITGEWFRPAPEILEAAHITPQESAA